MPTSRDQLEELVGQLISTPQLYWDERCARWRPSGIAIRCVVEPGAEEPTIWVDELELTLADLAALLASQGAPVCLVFLDD